MLQMVVFDQILFRLSNEILIMMISNIFFLSVYYSQNPDGTTSAIVNINTNYLNFLNNATQGILSQIGTIITVVVNTSKR
jgi:hypothetical protein